VPGAGAGVGEGAGVGVGEGAGLVADRGTTPLVGTVVGAVGVGSVWPQLAAANAATTTARRGARIALVCFDNITISSTPIENNGVRVALRRIRKTRTAEDRGTNLHGGCAPG